MNLLLMPSLQGQSHHISLSQKDIFKNFVEVKENNQPFGSILKLLETRDHIIWIVTEDEGLVEYNGNAFTHYRSSTGLGSLPSNRITNILEDDDHSLWISTRNGLCRFDRLKKKFIPYNYKGRVLETGGVVKLTDGRLICATNLGLCFINKTNYSLTGLPAAQVKNNAGIYYTGESIQSAGNLLYDKQGRLWRNITTQNLQGLASYDFQRNEWTLYPQENLYRENNGNPDKPGNITTWNLFPDINENKIWLGGYATGLRLFDKMTLSWQQYYFTGDSKYPDWNNAINTVYALTPDEVLTGTYLGLNLVNTKTNQAYKYTSVNMLNKPNLAAAAQCIMKDHCGNTWIGGQFGILRLHALNNRFSAGKRILEEPLDIQSAIEYPGNKLVLASTNITTKGKESRILMIKNGHVLKTVIPGANKKAGLQPFIKLESIAGKIIIFSGAGITIADSNLEHLEHLPISLQDPSGKTLEDYRPEYYSIAKWNDSIFYACRRTTSEMGFIKINIRSRKAWQYKPGASPGDSHPISGSIHWLYKDSYDRLWCCSDDQGLSIFYPATGRFEHYQSIPADTNSLPANIVRSVLQTSDGLFWISTNAGLCRSAALPGKKAVFQLIVPGIETNLLVEDRNKNLWVNHKDGNLKIEINTLQVKNYGPMDGFYWEGYHSKKILLNNGDFLLPDGELFNPGFIPRNNYIPLPFVSMVTVNNKELVADSAFPFKKNIELSHSENFISIAYSSDSYINEQQNTYSYKLTGIDTGWVNAGTRTTAYYTNLAPGTYHFWVKASNNDALQGAPANLLTLLINPAWYQTWWFKVLCIIVALLIIYSFYRLRIKQLQARSLAQRKEAELKQVKTEFEKQIAETEMIALRSQMNPHFIFNVLNSINRYILVNEGAKASLYLTQFSRLIRQVLENSKSAKVSLEADLSALQLYINMEKLRFEERFTYCIRVDKNIDQQFAQLPPLLIQPYVENAIWHGLMQKDKAGQLDIIITQPRENELQIVIQDNGIGRKKAMALQSKSATRHKSYGMQITSDRIDIVNKIYQVQASVKYEDLYNGEEAIGTRVTLNIPV
jgi:ligand-binding sensor domain-containing protein